MISLKAGAWECVLRPEIGGSVARLRRDNIDILRPMPAASREPLEAACFPLVPFCNRIAGASFLHSGRRVSLTPNHPPEPHALHGMGWHCAWEVADICADSARLLHSHDGALGWPWAYRSEQVIRLDGSGLNIELQIVNLAAQSTPAGLGLHPYFRRSERSAVQFAAASLVLSDSDLLPTGEEASADWLAPWSVGAVLPQATVDHCHSGWAGHAEIRDEQGTIRLEARNASYLHVYAPADGSALCLEPVSHRPDALNARTHDMAVLQPGEALSISMRITA